MYQLFSTSPGLKFLNKQVPIEVPAGGIVSNASSLRFTGKGFTNYGKIQQENLLHLLEHFAGPIAPENPTVGQVWYNTEISTLMVCVSTAPDDVIWEQLNAFQKGPLEPQNPSLGDLWFKMSGTHSGILYLYTGVGRFPEKAWDALTEEFYQLPSSATCAIKLNADSFSATVGSANSKFTIFGIDSTGAIQNTQGSVAINSTAQFIDNVTVYTACVPNVNGYIMYDTASMASINSTFVNSSGVGLGSRVFFVTPSETGTWMYDNGASLVPFTPSSSQYLIGLMSTNSTQISSGVLWKNGVSILEFEEYIPVTHSSGKIGGWEQVWPSVEFIGARNEYDEIYKKLMALIGDPIGENGSGAVGKVIDYLSPLEIMDASLQQIIVKSGDSNVFESSNNNLNTLKVQPTSQDWDLLLAACRYAISRLEVPTSYVQNLPSSGFVQDGLPLHPLVMNASPSDVKFLPQFAVTRKTNLKKGAIQSFIEYQELMNIIDYGLQSKFLLSGMYESSGISSYSPTVINPTYATIAGNLANLTGTKALEISIPFKNTVDQAAFLNSGGSIMVEVACTAASGVASVAGDLEFQSLFGQFGKLKVTANQSILFNYGYPASVVETKSTGFVQTSNLVTNVWSKTSGSSNISWNVGRNSAGTKLKIVLVLNSSSTVTLTNQLSIRISYIVDDVKYVLNGNVTPVFPRPSAYSTSNISGTGITAPPVFIV